MKSHSGDAAGRAIRDRFGVLDVLVNNAAVLLGEGTGILVTTPEAFEATWRANALGPLLVTQGSPAFSGNPRTDLLDDHLRARLLRLSKAALNAITVLLAAALKAKVNCVDPGWVRTDMGGAAAPRDVEQGAETIVDGKRIPW